MSAVLVLLGKIVGSILLVLLALLLLVLVLPFGVAVRWQAGALTVWAKAGPVSLQLYPRRAKKQQAEQPQAKPAAEPPNKPADEKSQPPQKPKAPPGETEKKEAPGSLRAKLDPAIKHLRSDPLSFVTMLFGHMGWTGQRLLRGIRVRHLRVFWTVTREDAAATATAYGRAIAAANILLEQAQQRMRVQSEELRIEPDFTGDLAKKRYFSCQITTQPYIMLAIGIRLVWRVLRDPAFKS